MNDISNVKAGDGYCNIDPAGILIVSKGDIQYGGTVHMSVNEDNSVRFFVNPDGEDDLLNRVVKAFN